MMTDGPTSDFVCPNSLYLAGPLFSEAEREFNAQLKADLESFFEVYLPQDDGDLLVELIEDGMDRTAAIDHIFRQDIEAIRDSDILLIILDGRAIDEGASFELGLAYAENKICVGLQTDPRRLLPSGNNPMIEAACDEIFHSTVEVVAWAKKITQEGTVAE